LFPNLTAICITIEHCSVFFTNIHRLIAPIECTVTLFLPLLYLNLTLKKKFAVEIKCLIIDNDAFSRETLRGYIQKFSFLTLMGSYESPLQTMDLLNS